MIKHIPNTITLLNLLSGCVALVLIGQGHLDYGAMLIFAAAIFDFFDGFAARLLRVSSSIGKELDSLADMVSFGLVPGMIMFELLRAKGNEAIGSFLPYLAFAITLFAALRLAKFNVDARQAEHFIGLPTPATALFIAALPLIDAFDTPRIAAFTAHPGFLWAIVIVFPLLMVSEIPLFALKFKSFAWNENKIKYTLIVLSIMLLAVFGIAGLPMIIILYLALSLIARKEYK